MAYIVYCHTNCKNGKRYVGWTSMTMMKRWHVHLKNARLGSMCLFHRAMRKWGTDDDVWTHEILEVMKTVTGAKHAERLWIAQRRTYAYDEENLGYNMTRGGDGSRGHHMTATGRETLRRLNTGKRWSDEARRRNSEAHAGALHSAQHVANQAKAICKPIAKCDLDRKVLEVYPSLKAAALSFDILSAGSRISEALKGRRRKTYKGFIWMYASKENHVQR